MDITTLERFLPRVKIIAQEAGRAILEVYAKTELNISYKADESPLTLADLASHRHIVKQLKELSPDIPVLSEESQHLPFSERQNWTTFWLVDPLDGTKEFIKRNGEFTVNIALIHNNQPVLGVVHAPVLDVSYVAAKSLGAFKTTSEGQTTRISVQDYQQGSLNIVASRSHAGPETELFLTRLKATFPNIQLLSVGSSLKFCLVAEGRAHLYPRFGPTMEWDTAAAQCVIEEAGGSVLNIGSGESLRYNHKDSLLNPFFIVSSSGVWLSYIQQHKPRANQKD